MSWWCTLMSHSTTTAEYQVQWMDHRVNNLFSAVYAKSCERTVLRCLTLKEQQVVAPVHFSNMLWRLWAFFQLFLNIELGSQWWDVLGRPAHQPTPAIHSTITLTKHPMRRFRIVSMSAFGDKKQSIWRLETDKRWHSNHKLEAKILSCEPKIWNTDCLPLSVL